MIEDLENLLKLKSMKLETKNEENNDLHEKVRLLNKQILKLKHELHENQATLSQAQLQVPSSPQKLPQKSETRNVRSPNGPHKLAIIVPFRERFDELLIFIPHMTTFLNTQLGENNFQFFIINQADMYRFNRASLINIGFLYALEEQCDYLVMHDVDLLPNHPEINYRFPEIYFDKGEKQENAEGEKHDFENSQPTDVVWHLSSPEFHPKYHYQKYIGQDCRKFRDF